MKALLMLSLIAFSFVACKPQSSAVPSEEVVTEGNVITGTISYNTREAIPTPYTVVVELYEVTDSGNVLVLSNDFNEESQVPVVYELGYDPAVVDTENKTYAITARFVDSNGNTIYESEDMVNPFNNAGSVDIMVVPVAVENADANTSNETAAPAEGTASEAGEAAAQ
jgi:uncharacterized lipoprotein YbaY